MNTPTITPQAARLLYHRIQTVLDGIEADPCIAHRILGSTRKMRLQNTLMELQSGLSEFFPRDKTPGPAAPNPNQKNVNKLSDEEFERISRMNSR